MNKKTTITVAQRLEIAIHMIPSVCPMIFKFEPTNLLYGKSCMIRQKRAFVVLRNENKCSVTTVTDLPLEHYDPLNPQHVLVHEIAFGHNLEECVPPCALWFNIPDGAITECTLSDQLKQNRTLKKLRQKQRMSVTGGGAVSSGGKWHGMGPSSSGGAEDEQDSIYHHYVSHRAFQMYYFHDSSLHQFMKEVMILELEKIHHRTKISLIANPTNHQPDETGRQWLHVREFTLQNQLESLKMFLLGTCWWPVNLGRDYVSDKTPVPSAESIYIVPPAPVVAKGRREEQGGEEKKSTFEHQWKSFLDNMQYNNVESQQVDMSSAAKDRYNMMMQRNFDQQQQQYKYRYGNEKGMIPSRSPSMFLGRFEHYHLSSSQESTTVSNHLPIFEYILSTAEALEWVPDYQECDIPRIFAAASTIVDDPCAFFYKMELEWKEVKAHYSKKNQKTVSNE
eukprot:CAMPEP_0176490594 /NCGR_PEP_ID=MMETSP0200_2-20121128/7958_1 /TAXON_ID=947934 /ORGANISM="Chaetoceros sp., Strain GSL56" /LENGTH=449 /DNA_ID=CAMNT_0017887919 /DNA_START=364 /DNA_END=1713 /DNA_ORIENTATION=+